MLDLTTRLRVARGARLRWEREATLRLGFAYVALTGDPVRGHERMAEALDLLARAHEIAALVALLERERGSGGPEVRFGSIVVHPPADESGG